MSSQGQASYGRALRRQAGPLATGNTPVAESALRYDKKVLPENFFRSYTLSRESDLLVHTADLISTI